MIAPLIILLIVFVLLGVPIAIAMGATSTVVFILSRGIENIPYAIVSQRVYYGLNNFTLLAIPFFLLAGRIMNESGVTTKIFNFAKSLVGFIPGSLGHVNILASMIFAGKSGSAVSDAAGLGSVIMKAMTDEGYDRDVSAAITGASSCIGPVIPPSIPMVLYGVLAGVSVGSLFIAGIIPGIIMGIALMILTFIIAKKRDFPKGESFSFVLVLKSFVDAILPLLTPIILIGGIWTGLFTPTEAAAVAVVYALFLGMIIYRSINFTKLVEILYAGLHDMAVIMFIVAAANLYGWIIVRLRIPMEAAEALLELTTHPIAVILLINLFLLIIGMFLETNSAVNILTPILVPIIIQVGINPLHFGIIMIINLMIGLLTPPLGMVLYTLTRVAKVPFYNLQRAIIPFIGVLLLVLLLIIFVPIISTWLPSMM